MRTLTIGDIHGNYRALLQVLERCNYDPSNDMLIPLGDYCDSCPDVKEVLDFFIETEYCTPILGNHDDWVIDWIRTKIPQPIHVSQGGWASIKSLEMCDSLNKYLEFLESALIYHKMDNMLFIHGGFPPGLPRPEDVSRVDALWDREMFYQGESPIFGVDAIFIGHTAVDDVEQRSNVWNIDTGAGWDGILTIMDVATKEYWQSDRNLYPESEGDRV